MHEGLGVTKNKIGAKRVVSPATRNADAVLAQWSNRRRTLTTIQRPAGARPSAPANVRKKDFFTILCNQPPFALLGQLLARD